MNNGIYAICGTAFFITFAIVVATYGNPFSVVVIAMALLFAGMSQFAAQGETGVHYLFAMGFVAMAILLALLAFVSFATTYPVR